MMVHCKSQANFFIFLSALSCSFETDSKAENHECISSFSASFKVAIFKLDAKMFIFQFQASPKTWNCCIQFDVVLFESNFIVFGTTGCLLLSFFSNDGFIFQSQEISLSGSSKYELFAGHKSVFFFAFVYKLYILPKLQICQAIRIAIWTRLRIQNLNLNLIPNF